MSPVKRLRVAMGIAVVSTAVVLAALVPAGAVAPTPTMVSESVSCNPDSLGKCVVSHALGVAPTSVVVTANIPDGWNSYMLSVIRDSFTATTFRVRAMSSSTQPRSGGTIWFSYIAYATGVAPPVSTTVPPSTTTIVPTTTPVTTTTTNPATTTVPPGPAGFPTASNAGVPAGTTFTRTMGLYYANVPGEVLDRVHSTDSIVIQASGVVIRNSLVDDTVLVESGSVTVEDTTIGPACGTPGAWNSGLSSANYTARRVHIRGHEDGFKAGGPNIRIEDSYIDVCGHDGAHSDGIQDYPSADGLVINHNTFDMMGEPGQNSPVYINAGDKGGTVSNNVTITNNLGLGGAYTFYLWPGTGTWIVKGNRAVTDTGTFGAYTTGGRCSRVGEWSDNDIVTVGSNYGIASTVRDNVPCA